MGKTYKIELEKTVVGASPRHWGHMYFSETTISDIAKAAGGLEHDRIPALRAEIEGIAHYFASKLNMKEFAVMNREPQPTRVALTEGEEAKLAIDLAKYERKMGKKGRPKKLPQANLQADHLFYGLVWDLGKIWLDPSVFDRGNVTRKVRDGKAGGDFTGFVLAVCNAFGIRKTKPYTFKDGVTPPLGPVTAEAVHGVIKSLSPEWRRYKKEVENCKSKTKNLFKTIS
jgi:hypothetical protein